MFISITFNSKRITRSEPKQVILLLIFDGHCPNLLPDVDQATDLNWEKLPEIKNF